jgi:hypothetical protein
MLWVKLLYLAQHLCRHIFTGHISAIAPFGFNVTHIDLNFCPTWRNWSMVGVSSWTPRSSTGGSADILVVLTNFILQPKIREKSHAQCCIAPSGGVQRLTCPGKISS